MSWTRADVADHLGGADIAHTATCFHIAARNEAEEEASGKLVACACGINGDDLCNGDIGALAFMHDADAIARTGADDKRTCGGDAGEIGLEIIVLIERANFGFVADDEVHFVLDEADEIGAVALDAEGIGNCDTCFAASGTAGAGCTDEGVFAFVFVKEIALKEHNLSASGNAFINVIGAKLG